MAQLGSAPRLGRGGRTFKSCHPDHLEKKEPRLGFFFSFREYMKIRKICSKNISLKDWKNNKFARNIELAKENNIIRLGNSYVRCFPEVQSSNFSDIARIEKQSPVKESKFDKFLAWLDKFVNPPKKTNDSMAEFRAQVEKRMADWRKVFG